MDKIKELENKRLKHLRPCAVIKSMSCEEALPEANKYATLRTSTSETYPLCMRSGLTAK